MTTLQEFIDNNPTWKVSFIDKENSPSGGSNLMHKKIKFLENTLEKGLEEQFWKYTKLNHKNLVEIICLVESSVENRKKIGYVIDFFSKGILENYALLPETAHYRNIITPRRLYKWAIQLADAVQFMHNNEYIYGDICLKKILVSDDLATDKLNFPSYHVIQNKNEEVTGGLPKENTKEHDVYCLLKVFYSMEHRVEASTKLEVKSLRVDANKVFKDLIIAGCSNIQELTATRVYKILVDRENERADAQVPQIKLENVDYSTSITSNRECLTFSATIRTDGTKKQYAAKIFSNKGQQRHIRREVENLCNLNHENIQKIKYIITSDNEDEIQGVLREFMPNGSVGDFVYGSKSKEDHGVLIPTCIVSWFVQLADALKYCHELKIIHRNVRPTKMLLTADYKSIQLTDFSTSRIADENMTSDISVDPFKAPEAINNTTFKNDNAYKLDVWGFGMSLYTCCNKERILPFKHDFEANPRLQNKKKLWKEFVENDHNRPRIELYDIFKNHDYIHCGSKITEVITKCWKTKPNERPSMADVFETLTDGIPRNQ